MNRKGFLIVSMVVKIFLFVSIEAYAQVKLPMNDNDGRVTYSEVVQAPGNDTKAIYDHLKMWIADHSSTSLPMKIIYDNDSSVIQVLAGFYADPSRGSVPFDFFYKIRWTIKEGRFKYEVYDLTFSYSTRVSERGMMFYMNSFAIGSSVTTDSKIIQYPIEVFYPNRSGEDNFVRGVPYFNYVGEKTFFSINSKIQEVIVSFSKVKVVSGNW